MNRLRSEKTETRASDGLAKATAFAQKAGKIKKQQTVAQKGRKLIGKTGCGEIGDEKSSVFRLVGRRKRLKEMNSINPGGRKVAK